MLDFTTEFGQRVTRRLAEEHIIWLTTVSADGTPQPRPVWFLWDGETFLIYSKPDTYKMNHIVRQPQIALNLDGDGLGRDIVLFTGKARFNPDAPPAVEVPEYAEKYLEWIKRTGMSATEFTDTYSAAIRVTPLNLRGH
ncbi:MAG: TIGR03667 family PPOX class F420-dependent oxidoreductase [Proteobacteria bacterium]|nr:TIGR03667 family PPOX class F420-dependent oxidoreductase [Pseudomonadota bacterium]